MPSYGRYGHMETKGLLCRDVGALPLTSCRAPKIPHCRMSLISEKQINDTAGADDTLRWQRRGRITGWRDCTTVCDLGRSDLQRIEHRHYKETHFQSA